MAQNENLGSAAAAAAIAVASLLLAGAGAPSLRAAALRILAAVVVWFWCEDVYGRGAALGATLLFSFHPLVAAAAPEGGLIAVLLFTAAAYRALRCLLDPSLQDAVAIGAVAGVALWITPAAWGLAVLLLALAVARVMTRNPHEGLGRTGRACAAALLICTAAAALSWRLLGAVAVPRAGLGLAVPLGRAELPVVCSLVPLALIAVRPWRPQRRYADATALAAIVSLGAAAWWAEGAASAGAFAALPAAAVLAGAVWDHGTAVARRTFAWALVAVQIAVVTFAA